MNITIRNLDQVAYRRIKARAAIEGKTVGELISDAIRAFTREPALSSRKSDVPAGRAKRPAKQERGQKGAVAAPFVRPPPQWGEFVDDPMVIFEVEPEP